MKSNPSASTAPSERLAGIEWMRGIAAFGVICIHSGIAVHNHGTPNAAVLRASLGFAVPFFLITSFFWAFRTEFKRQLPWGDWLRRQSGRLLIPFVFWSLIYFSLHALKLLVHHQSGQIWAILADPVGLVLSGGTSIALYFIPILFMGLVLTHLLAGLFKRSPWWILAAGFVATLFIYESSYLRSPTYLSNPNWGAATLPVQFILQLLDGGIGCAPLVFAAGFLARYLPPPDSKNATPLLIVGFLLMLLVLVVSVPGSAKLLARGLGSFLLAWGLSGLFPANPVATVVGQFSFGVYLVHQVFLELLQVVLPPQVTLGVAGSLGIAALVYAASMVAVGLANRGGSLTRNIFGLR